MAEVIGTSARKASEGFIRRFIRLLPSVVVVLGYAVAFHDLSLVLKTLPVGIAYAVWSGLGIVLITLVAFVVYGQTIDLPGLIGMGLIVAGVVVLNVFSKARCTEPGKTAGRAHHNTLNSFSRSSGRRLAPMPWPAMLASQAW